MNDPVTYAACQSCKLYQGCYYYKANAITEHSNPDLYVVTDRLNQNEETWLTTKAGQWVRKQLATSGVQYIIDGALRCSTDKKVNITHYRKCRPFLLENINRVRPKVILCLGYDAARALLDTELSFAQLMKAGVLRGPHDIPVIVVDPPDNYKVDLASAYRRAWLLISKILTKGWEWPVINVEIVSSFEDALAQVTELRKHTDVFGTDTEFGLQPSVSVHHPSTKLLCAGIGYYQFERNSYRSLVLDCYDWSMAQKQSVFYELYKGSTVSSVFMKIDQQVLHHFGGYNFYGRAGVRKAFDLGQVRWCQDQEQMGNGLEDMASEYLGAPRWKHTMDELFLKLQKTSKSPPDGMAEWDYRHIYQAHRQELLYYQGVDVFNQARLWWEEFGDERKEFRELKESWFTWAYERTRLVTKFLSAIEDQGLTMDLPRLRRYLAALEKVQANYTQWLDDHPYARRLRDMGLLNGVFNPASTDQMAAVCNMLGISTRQTTPKTNKPKVDKREIMRQAGGTFDPDHPRTKQQQWWLAIRKWRSNAKKTSSFVKPFLDYEIDGKVHTMYKMTKVVGQSGTDTFIEGGVDTGRNSSANPCITNIIKDEEFLNCFPAPGPEWECYSADMASVEPRVIAYNSGCKAWIDLFELRHHEPDNPAADLYNVAWAEFERSMGKPWFTPDQVSKKDRNGHSKPLVLGAMYDATPLGVHLREDVPYDIALRFMDVFWDQFHELLAYNAMVRKAVMAGEMLVGGSGRRARFQLLREYDYDPSVHDKLPLYRLQEALDIDETNAHIIRKAANHMTQGMAKDILDVAAIRLVDTIERERIGWCKFTNTVHDSIWGYNLKEKREEHYWLMTNHMSDTSQLAKYGIQFACPIEQVRLAAEIEYGPTYGATEVVRYKPSQLSNLLKGVR